MKKYIFFFLLLFTISAYSSMEKIKYLENRKSDISLKYNADDYKGFLEDFKNHTVILAGEMHGIKENYLLRLNLLRFLNENAGVKYYLAEMGYSSSYFINKYLDSGDEKYLFLVSNSIKNSYDHSAEDLEFWKNLYKYNTTLSQEKRVKIIGLDLEHQSWLSVLHLAEILEEKDLGPDMKNTKMELKKFATSICPDSNNSKNIIKNAAHINKPKLFKIIEKIQLSIENRTDSYEKSFTDEELFALNFLLKNISDTKKAYLNLNNTDFFYEAREICIYDNFLRFHSRHSSEKYFGQWGNFHVMQKKNNKENRFGAYLNQEESPVKNKVISIKYVYDNKSSRKTNKKILKALKAFSESKITMYNIENPHHKTNDSCPLNDYADSDISNFFQYGILIRSPQKVTIL